MAYCFANCRLDAARQEFLRDGEQVHLEPQVFALLELLARSDGALVSKEALIDHVWKGLAISDSTISARINAARCAVGDDGKAQKIIQTVHKRGFRLAVPVTAAGAPVAPATSPPDIRFVPSFDTELIAYASHGDGPPLMRAGHWLSHLELDWECPVWRPFLDALGANFTVCRYDQRGTGLTTRRLGEGDLDDFVADFLAVADANGLDRFPIFAASQAVSVALRFAARYPKRVSRLALYGGYAVGRAYRTPVAGDIDEDTILGLIRAGWGDADSAFFNAFSGLFMPDATPEQKASFVRIQNASISPDNAARLRHAVDRFCVTEDLPQVQAPTLILHAAGDAIQPVEESRKMAGALRDARFIMLDGRNHVPLPQDACWPRLMEAVTSFCLEA